VRHIFEAATHQYARALPCLTFTDVGWRSGKSADPEYKQRCQREPAIFVMSNSMAGCYSYIGVQASPSQQLNLQDPGCTLIGTAIHELGHAMGMAHEQSRPDRDKYLRIHYDNIRASQVQNFHIEPGAFTGNPYDYRSVMHYDSYAFAVNPKKPTLTRTDGGHGGELGQRMGLAQYDVVQLEAMYGKEVPGCTRSDLSGIGCIDLGAGKCPEDVNECRHFGVRGSRECCTCGGGIKVQCYKNAECPHSGSMGATQDSSGKTWRLAVALGTSGVGVLLIAGVVWYWRRR